MFYLTNEWLNEWMFNDTPAQKKPDRLLGVRKKGKRNDEMVYLTKHTTPFIYCYMVKDHSGRKPAVATTWATLSD